MAGIGIILNRNAGKHRPFRGKIGEKLAFVLGDPHTLMETNTIDEIDDVAKKFAEKQIDILGISGGDGSNHYAMDRFIKVYGSEPLPKVAFLCGGTHNAHAASVGIKGTPEKLLDDIIRLYHQGGHFQTVLRKTIQVDDGRITHYGFSLATGFMCRFYQELISRQKETPLKVASLLAQWIGSFAVNGKKIRKVFELKPGKITISGNLLPWEQTNGVSCSSMEKLGLGFTPYPRANETPNTFQVGALRIKPGGFIRLMWGFRRNKVLKDPNMFHDITDHVLLEAEEPLTYVFDGEIYEGTNRLEVRTGPKFELIVI